MVRNEFSILMPVKAVQTVMRHSSIALRMDTYGHLFPGQEAETIALLPLMMGAAETFVLQQSQNGAQHWVQQLGREFAQDGGTACEALRMAAQSEGRHNSLPFAELGDALRASAVVDESAPRRTRTYNPLIKSLSGAIFP